MKQYRFDVIIIGAGPAGVAAAGALAGAGISVALIEAGVYAGAENWSGCVYFTENLAADDCFGPAALAAAPFERKVVRRGTLLHNGLDAVGLELSNADTFAHCYTVLRPMFDPYFARLAASKGAVLLESTTVTSLIRKEGRVVGVQTNQGPLYSGVTFLAEGDASHLVRSERLERVLAPHFFQGVKAVLSLHPDELEQRFRLKPGEGAAYELLIRNAAIAGRTAKLNAGGFLYTNRDSLSLGYVAPLDNMRNNYRGDHDRLFEWMRNLPMIRELTEGATLSSYGTRIIRSGGWRERPILVEDGLAVGGAATGLGVDMPFPNFTGPASASGLYFARAIKQILKRGSTCDARHLTREYLLPLQESVYGSNAKHLSAWPGYFGRSSVLFGRTVDVACGTAHFLSSRSIVETGRFLRSHILSFRGLKELSSDTIRAISSLRLWKPLAVSAIDPSTLGIWCANLLKRTPERDPKLRVVMRIDNRDVDATTLPRPIGPLIMRMTPALVAALEQVYANDTVPIQQKFARAVRIMLRSLKPTDFVVLPAFGLALFFIALSTALWDAFRFYVLKTPVQKLLNEPVMAYNESQKKARDLDAIKPVQSLEHKLAMNTYRTGAVPHIRTLWPETVSGQADMSLAGLWWVCPARVYGYDAPPFAGRGRVTVNYENCIKCESCWQSEPQRVLWGRHTGHQLIYRPESAAIPLLLASLKDLSRIKPDALPKPEVLDDRLFYLAPETLLACNQALNASAAFRKAISHLPASADKSRTAWPAALAKRLIARLARLTILLSDDNRTSQVRLMKAESEQLEQALEESRLFQALYRANMIEQQVKAWAPARKEAPVTVLRSMNNGISSDEVSGLFPDRIVKQWEDEAIPGEWARKLGSFIAAQREQGAEVVRALSYISPALGLIAAHQTYAVTALAKAGITLGPGVCAVNAEHLDIEESIDRVRIRGRLSLVPVATSATLLLMAHGRGHLVQLETPGVTVTPAPGIGFRAAGFADITLDCAVKKLAIVMKEHESAPDAASYLAIALGVGEYLCKRVKEHAAGRIQFPGQMLDTEGRDGIAKLGAVKALIGRTEAWRLLLASLYDLPAQSSIRDPRSAMDLDLLRSTLAALAYSPEPGSMGYDAGQVFGGFAYSEDDLLSRSYRDSALFRFLVPGYGAAAQLHGAIKGRSLDTVLPELGSLKHVQAEPLGKRVQRLFAVNRSCAALPAKAHASRIGAVQALALGIRAVLVAVEKGLDQGRSMEAETAAADVLLGLAEEALAQAIQSAGMGTVPPEAVFPIEPACKAAALETDYEAFCHGPGKPHQSGGFLAISRDPAPRFVPEMQLHDPKLRLRWLELTDWFKKNCRDKLFDGLHVERFIEKQHRLPDEVLAAAKANKWLATTVPVSEHGLGWHKAEYYILNAAAGSFGDASIDLLIMASTSIGTTPILLGLEEELPRVREELAPLAEDEQKLGEIGSRLARLVGTLDSPNPGWIKKEYEAVMKFVDSRIRRTRVVKYLAANFLRAFYGAGVAGRRGDFGGFIANLRHADGLFTRLMPDVRAALEELPRRERCHKLFLRYLGHGGVSAFALTEPTAGSDSGGVKTTAQLHSAKLRPLDDGRYSFVLAEGDASSIRYVIDADRIVFLDNGLAYQTPDKGSALIRYDQYDYTTDQGLRSYQYQGKDCVFHDIGQVRQKDGVNVYEYYSLTGAKMWITNGSIATQFCLYALTPEGVTGFMVDRHAEGLKVGADEKKTGQRGSPTNEISIDNARVSRESVIGYEGHGQVNALETLNVGRCGLAVVSGALMRKLMQEALGAIPRTSERDDLLGEAAAVLFGSESLAYYLVGLFDRPHESVRMESAIAKYVCSEDIHEFLSLMEQAFGPAGQTEKHLLEKARRDSRILTIYEGTNEVQRFLILKDLIAMAKDWTALPEEQTDPAAAELAKGKNRLRALVKDAAEHFGDNAWADAMLQPALFPLAEMAGELLKLECVLHRSTWLEQHEKALSPATHGYVPLMLAAAKRAAERSRMRFSEAERKFHAAWELVSNDLDMPEVQAADAAMDLAAREAVKPEHSTGMLLPALRILAIVRPVADLSPTPRLIDNALQELVWRIDPSDLAALRQVLELKALSSQVIVDVLMPGGPEHETLLRSEAGALADNLFQLNTNPASGSQVMVRAVKGLEALEQYGLIITGANCMNGDQSLGAYVAGSLKRVHYRRECIQAKADTSGLEHISLPAVVSITAAALETTMAMDRKIESAYKRVALMESAGEANAPLRYELPVADKTVNRGITDPAMAADYVKTFAAAESAASAMAYAGEVAGAALPEADAIWAVLDPQEHKSNLAVLRASKHYADLIGIQARAIICAPKETWPQQLGLAKANGCSSAFCVDTQQGRLSIDGKRAVLAASAGGAKNPIVLGGMEWSSTFGYMAGERETDGSRILLCSGVTNIEKQDGGLVLSLPVYNGMLVRKDVLVSGKESAFLTIAPEAEFPTQSPASKFKAAVLELEIPADWIMPLPPVLPLTLTQADVIIDLGYGIKDRAGFALAEELKKTLEAMGLSPLFGATRKVTQDLKLLPLDAQIGQTGVRVNPKLIIALGISGAPQHIDYIGSRAEVLCFNKDKDAPLMQLNKIKPVPRVHPISGDLFVTVRELIDLLKKTN